VKAPSSEAAGRSLLADRAADFGVGDAPQRCPPAKLPLVSKGHRTSAIARPERERTRASVRTSGKDHTRVGDFTRPIPVDRQLVTRRSNRWVLATLGFAVVGALLAALFVLPVQAWMRQKTEIDNKNTQLAVLTKTNGPLQAEVNRLGTTEGAREAARDELSMVEPGEERISVMPAQRTGALPLPTGWPYDTLTQIVSVRWSPPVPAATVP
jgi:cell division protein FtsB